MAETISNNGLKLTFGKKPEEEKEIIIANTRANLSNPANIGKKIINKAGQKVEITQAIVDEWKNKEPKKTDAPKVETKKEEPKEEPKPTETKSETKTETKAEEKQDKQDEEAIATAENEAKDIAEEVAKDPENAQKQYEGSPFLMGVIGAYRKGLFGDTTTKEGKKEARKSLTGYIFDIIGTALMQTAGVPTQSAWSKDREGIIQNKLEEHKREMLGDQIANASKEKEEALIKGGFIKDRPAEIQDTISKLLEQKKQAQNQIADLRKAKAKGDAEISRQYLDNAIALINTSIGTMGDSQSLSQGQTDTTSGQVSVGLNVPYVQAGGSYSQSSSSTQSAQAQKTASNISLLQGTTEAISQNLANSTGKPVPLTTIYNDKQVYQIDKDKLTEMYRLENSPKIAELLYKGYTEDVSLAKMAQPQKESLKTDFNAAIDEAIKGLENLIKMLDEQIKEWREQQKMSAKTEKKPMPPQTFQVKSKISTATEGGKK